MSAKRIFKMPLAPGDVSNPETQGRDLGFNDNFDFWHGLCAYFVMIARARELTWRMHSAFGNFGRFETVAAYAIRCRCVILMLVGAATLRWSPTDNRLVIWEASVAIALSCGISLRVLAKLPGLIRRTQVLERRRMASSRRGGSEIIRPRFDLIRSKRSLIILEVVS
jgi:hypothetical protein